MLAVEELTLLIREPPRYLLDGTSTGKTPRSAQHHYNVVRRALIGDEAIQAGHKADRRLVTNDLAGGMRHRKTVATIPARPVIDEHKVEQRCVLEQQTLDAIVKVGIRIAKK